jgi:hypothetical protein
MLVLSPARCRRTSRGLHSCRPGPPAATGSRAPEDAPPCAGLLAATAAPAPAAAPPGAPCCWRLGRLLRWLRCAAPAHPVRTVLAAGTSPKAGRGDSSGSLVVLQTLQQPYANASRPWPPWAWPPCLKGRGWRRGCVRRAAAAGELVCGIAATRWLGRAARARLGTAPLLPQLLLTLAEAVLEPAGQVLQGPHAPGAGGAPADGLLAPLVCGRASDGGALPSGARETRRQSEGRNPAGPDGPGAELLPSRLLGASRCSLRASRTHAARAAPGHLRRSRRGGTRLPLRRGAAPAACSGCQSLPGTKLHGVGTETHRSSSWQRGSRTRSRCSSGCGSTACRSDGTACASCCGAYLRGQRSWISTYPAAVPASGGARRACPGRFHR